MLHPGAMYVSAPARGFQWAGAALVACLLLSSCTGPAAEPGSDQPTGTSAPPAADPVPTKVRVGTVTGEVPPGLRKRAVRAVVDVTDDYLDAAFVAANYPQEDFAAALPGFTPAAAELARRDLDELTNARLGPRIEGISVNRREVSVDLLAVHGQAAGATARVRLDFRTVGAGERRVRLSGRLFLRPAGDSWEIFGYDLAQGRV